ncbi:hypothetical protein A9D60_23455 [Leisingera sp. JC1]|nr:hypothetical protein A9D60_23455 [Leisingera sp. JC1]
MLEYLSVGINFEQGEDSDMKQWVIFDGDNTLWDIECLYNQARQNLIKELADLGVCPEEAEIFQRMTDVELFQSLGYSQERFPKSFSKTLLHFKPLSSDLDVEKVEEMARTVFTSNPTPFKGAAKTIHWLKRHFKIGLLSAGPRQSQLRKIQHFCSGDDSLFDAVEVVSLKTPDVLRDFCLGNNINPSHSWMIGDSLKHDIKPALSIGLNAIHVNSENWSELEVDGHLQMMGFDKVGSIEEILGVFEEKMELA